MWHPVQNAAAPGVGAAARRGGVAPVRGALKHVCVFVQRQQPTQNSALGGGTLALLTARSLAVDGLLW